MKKDKTENTSKHHTNRKHVLGLVFAAVLMLSGLYLLLLIMTPQITFVSSPYEVTGTEVEAAQEKLKDENYIRIEKVNLLVPFYTGTNEKVLDKGAWHRYPDRGDPEKGGNFILSAHRFRLDLTPSGTKQKSPFYTLNKVVIGDSIDIRFEGKDYHYRVTKTYPVKPDAVEIEDPSETAKLTLYTCTLKGSTDGRTVVEAELL